jgi:hypothetical protein
MSPTINKCTNKNQMELEERCKKEHTKFDEPPTREIKAKSQGRRWNCDTKRSGMIS